jgi:hypothetical protein
LRGANELGHRKVEDAEGVDLTDAKTEHRAAIGMTGNPPTGWPVSRRIEIRWACIKNLE